MWRHLTGARGFSWGLGKAAKAVMFQLRPEGHHIFLSVPSLHRFLTLRKKGNGQIANYGWLFRALGLVWTNPCE